MALILPRKCQSKTVKLLLQLLSQTSLPAIATLLLVRSLYRFFDIHTHTHTHTHTTPHHTHTPHTHTHTPYTHTHTYTHTYTHTHIIYCECYTVGPISLCFLLPLPSSISANLFAAQIVSPISCLQYLPRTLSMSFHTPFNLHTSIHLTVTHRFINNAQSVYIYPVLGVSDTHLSVYTNAWCVLPLTQVFFADPGGIAV